MFVFEPCHKKAIMNKTTLLHHMCSDDLTQADIRAIGKSRGLSRTEIANRTTFENFYLSPVGVEQAMATLTPAEIALLHLLHMTDKIATLEDFGRLYSLTASTSYYNRTYTQRYQPVLKKVRAQLVRKGILIMAQIQSPNVTKMERWRFLFPSEFAPYLPRPMSEIQQLDTAGKTRRDVPRSKLLALTGQTPPPVPDIFKYQLSLKNGRLLSGKRPFQANDMQEWRKASWIAVMPDSKRKGKNESIPHTEKITTIDALNYALGLLKPNEWVTPDKVAVVLNTFCHSSFDVAAICRLGWEWGYLAGNSAGDQPCYRLAAPEEAGDEPAPATYLSVLDERTAFVNLQTIPYTALEQLNQIAYLAIQGEGLTAVSDFIHMGAATQDTLNSPLTAWLVSNIPAFAETRKTIEKRWGKQIVHTNLHIARVKDFALRVKIERALKENELTILSDEYIAFPPKLLPKVQKIVDQAGHVVKNFEGK